MSTTLLPFRLRSKSGDTQVLGYAGSGLVRYWIHDDCVSSPSAFTAKSLQHLVWHLEALLGWDAWDADAEAHFKHWTAGHP